MLRLLAHDERLEYLTHSFTTTGLRITVAEPLEVHIEGHRQTVPRWMPTEHSSDPMRARVGPPASLLSPVA
jgi:hypothetical protein